MFMAPVYSSPPAMKVVDVKTFVASAVLVKAPTRAAG
jgi:hypothetical protein